MFLITYKSPLWDKKNPSSRFTRAVISGLLVYSLIYAFTYTKYSQNIDLLVDNRKYIIGIAVVDLIITIYCHNKAKKKQISNQNFVEYVQPNNGYIPDNYVPSSVGYVPPNIPIPIPIPKVDPIYNQEEQAVKLDAETSTEEVQSKSQDKSSASIPVYNEPEDIIPLYVSNNAT